MFAELDWHIQIGLILICISLFYCIFRLRVWRIGRQASIILNVLNVIIDALGIIFLFIGLRVI